MSKRYSSIRHDETNGHFSVDFIDLDARDLIASYAGDSDSEDPTCPVINTVNNDDATYPSAEDAHKAISDSLAAAGYEFVPGPVDPAIIDYMHQEQEEFNSKLPD